MKFKAIAAFLAQYYERILAVLVMLALVVFSAWLMIRVNRLEVEIGKEEEVIRGAAAKPDDVAKLRKSFEEMLRPLEWSTNSSHRLFIGPNMIEKEGLLVEVDRGQIGKGKTKEGIDREWLRRYRLPTKGLIADSDMDKDGFTVYEEYVSATDPTDPANHPDYSVKLRVYGPLVQDAFPFVFNGVSERGGENLFQIARLDRRAGPYFVRMNEVIPDRYYKGFKIIRYEQKSMDVENRAIKGADGKYVVQKVDVSLLTVQREGAVEVTLMKGRQGKMPDLAAHVLFLLDPKLQPFKISVNSTFPLQNSQYQVLSIKKLDGDKPEVIIQKLDQDLNPLEGKTFKLEPFTRESLQKGRPTSPTAPHMNPLGTLGPPAGPTGDAQPPPPGSFGFPQ